MNLYQSLIIGIVPVLLTGIGVVFWTYRANLFLWIKKQKLKFFPVNFNIAFSIEFEEGLNSGGYFKEIKKNFNKIIDNFSLSENIKIKDLSTIKKFENRKEAERFVKNKNIDLLIWGDFSNDTLKKKNKKVSNIDFKFTYRYPDDKKGKIGKMIALDINSKLAQKQYWKILESNSIEDVRVITGNLFDLSLYVVALTLKLYGRIGESSIIFEKLSIKLKDKNDNFSNSVIKHLINCYALFIIEAIYKKNFGKGIKFCKKIMKFQGNNLFALANLATLQYKIGETKESEKNVNLMLKLYPGNSLTEVDVAFIRILQKRYNSAFKHYERLIKSGDVSFKITEIIEFLDNEYENTKEPALLYGSGILSYYWGDKKIGKDDLRLFVKKIDNEIYKKMRRKACKILKNTQEVNN